jgi:hypothetical protein
MSAVLRSALTAVTIVGVTLLGLILACSAVAATNCGDGCPTLSARTTTPAAGARLTVAGTDFGGSHRVNLMLQGAPNPLGRARTDSTGAFRTTIRLPARVIGRHTIVASEPATGAHAEQLLTISVANARQHNDAAGGSGDSSRGYAGVAFIGLGALCVVLLIGGGLLLLTGRRRRLSV